MAALETTAHDFQQLMAFLVERARASLDRTPELLPVLKKAGVVDAGGKGFVHLLEGVVRYIHGEPVGSGERACHGVRYGFGGGPGCVSRRVGALPLLYRGAGSGEEPSGAEGRSGKAPPRWGLPHRGSVGGDPEGSCAYGPARNGLCLL